MRAEEWDLLRGLDPVSAEGLLALTKTVRAPKGTVLFKMGDPAESAFLLVAGKVDLTLPLMVGDSREEVMVEERHPGQLVGWSGLVPPFRFTLEAVASVNSELLALPGVEALDYFDQHPEIGHKVLSNLAHLIGRRLQLFQTMWVRGMQKVLEVGHG